MLDGLVQGMGPVNPIPARALQKCRPALDVHLERLVEQAADLGPTLRSYLAERLNGRVLHSGNEKYARGKVIVVKQERDRSVSGARPAH